MTEQELRNELRKVAGANDFALASNELTETWSERKVGGESIKPILEFMEEHPHLDYGMPGALVHFVEEFYQNGYEELLIDSIDRYPTMLTVWMLNRVINGVRDPVKRTLLISTMERAESNPRTDSQTRERICDFLGRLH